MEIELPAQIPVWVKAQAVGLIFLEGVKLFTTLNPVTGSIIAAATVVTEAGERYIFEKLHFHDVLKYGSALAFSTLCLHTFMHIFFPAMDNLLKFDLKYVKFRLLITTTYMIGVSLFNTYGPKKVPQNA